MQDKYMSKYGQNYIDESITSLKTSYLPDDDLALEDIDAKKDVAAKLFNKSCRQIESLEKDPYFKYFNSIRKIQKLNVEFRSGSKKSFYLKSSWEGKYLEACGMELHNLFFDEKFNYIISNNNMSKIIAIEEIDGKTFGDLNPKELNNTIATNYGSALEFAAMIGLDDREQTENFIITPNNNVINIDYGKLFQKQYNNQVKPCITIPKNFEKQMEQSRRKAKEEFLECIKEKRSEIEEIIRQTRNLDGFYETKYAQEIHKEYIYDTYNTMKRNLERRA